MSVKDLPNHGPDHDSPAGDSAQGAPQVESGGGPVDRASEFWVNQAFIDVHGVEAARRLQAAVESVHGTDIPAVREELAARFAEAGIEVPSVELDKYADRIVNSADAHVEVHDLREAERHQEEVTEGGR